MFNILKEIPRKVTIAVSGGPDSMAVLDFLKNSHEVTACYFNHGTQHGSEAEALVTEYCKDNNIKLVTNYIKRPKPKGQSTEEFWRGERLNFFHRFREQVVTGHHLQDQMEWWLFTSTHGNPRLIPYNNGNVIRPFLTTPREEFREWCIRKEVPFLDDPSNQDRKYMRNLIRNEILPLTLEVNPGLAKTIKKLVEKQNKT